MNTLSLATINAANLGEWSDAARIHNFARSIVEDLKSPMIIAVQEIGGVVREGEELVQAHVATDIIQQLKDEFGQEYHYADIAPLPETTGGAENINIRCGFLYRAPIQLVSLAQIGAESEIFTGSESKEFVPCRLPLLGKFALNDQEFYVVNCHLKSMSIKYQTKKQAKKQRNRQASLIASYLHDHNIFAKPLMIVGDMNDTFASKTVQALASHDLSSAHSALKFQIYTYKYHKKTILLDYILYNDKLEYIESEIVHVNTDKASERSYSDHDPLMMICRLC